MKLKTKHSFTVLEGVDGTGKSTVAKLLADMMNAALVKTPLSPMLEQRRYYDDCGLAMARYLFYLTSNVVVSEHIQKLLETRPVVCDRYLVSTICFHKAMGVDTDAVDVKRLGLLEPDYYFCLQADEPVRLTRLAERGYNSDTDGQHELLRAVNKLLPQYCSNVIDTTYLTAKEVAQMIYNIVS